MADTIWLFGYGSLIWRPDIPHRRAEPAHLPGYERRFWQGSHDHRGLPHAPGRVVTLVPGRGCDGLAFEIDFAVWQTELSKLDHREKNGYERHTVPIRFRTGGQTDGVVYFAHAGNFAFLGDAPLEDIAQQISDSAGPSGHNADYLFELAAALRRLDAHDPHVFELERLVRNRNRKRET